MRQPISFFVFQKHSVFLPLRFLYPECSVLIEPYEQLAPLHCLQHDHCPANQGCMDTLVRRVNYLFTEVVPQGEQIIAYFKYHDRPKSLRAGVFLRDLSEPRRMVLNRSAFDKFRAEGKTFSWVPTDDFLFAGGRRDLLPVENLLVKP